MEHPPLHHIAPRERSNRSPYRGFAWLLVGIALLLVWQTADIFLLTFAAVLLAVFLRILVGIVSRYTPLHGGYALATVVVLLCTLLGLAGWLIAPDLLQQITLIVDALPDAVRDLQRQLAETSAGRRLLDQVPAMGEAPFVADVLMRAASVFSSTLNLLAYLIFVLFVSLFLAIDPDRYRRGIIRLFPPARRPRVKEIVATVVSTLRAWILGRALSMLIVGCAVGLGLWLIGVPLALGLGFIAGLFEFVPYIGPVASAVPALLIAAAKTPEWAVYVALLYLAVQQIEGNVLTPLIQEVAVHMPPVLTLMAAFIMGALFGTLGLLVATPLAAVGLLLVRMIYLEDTLGETPPRRSARQTRETEEPITAP